MKKILYLSLLMVIPMLVSAGHGRDRINGKWVNPYFHKEIKIKVKRDYIKVKGLTRRNRWVEYTQIGRSTFEDCDGNRIRINSIHDLVFTEGCTRDRIRFTKKGHQHHGHVCGGGCSYAFGGHGGSNHHGDSYDGDYGYYSGYEDQGSYYYNDRRNKGYNDNRRNSRIGGKYFVREIDRYVSLQSTSRGLKARLGNERWVNYRQNAYRKNEYIDDRGNRYVISSNGIIKWRSNDGAIVLNLDRV